MRIVHQNSIYNSPSTILQIYASFKSYFQKYDRSRRLRSSKSQGMNRLTLMLLVAYLGNTKWCKKAGKWLKPWHMGTHLRVLSESYPMNTNMTWFRWFPKIFAPLHFGSGESSLSTGRVNIVQWSWQMSWWHFMRYEHKQALYELLTRRLQDQPVGVKPLMLAALKTRLTICTMSLRGKQNW